MVFLLPHITPVSLPVEADCILWEAGAESELGVQKAQQGVTAEKGNGRKQDRVEELSDPSVGRAKPLPAKTAQ